MDLFFVFALMFDCHSWQSIKNQLFQDLSWVFLCVDYQDDIQKHMQAATDFLQSCYDSVDGPPGE